MKQLETVYVPTNEDTSLYLVSRKTTYSQPNILLKLQETQAYLYTPEEHAAVQGYREALEKINKIANTSIDGIDAAIFFIVKKALSKEEDKGEETYGEFMRSNPPQPTNSLDELERWIKAESKFVNYPLNINAKRTVDLVLSKIQELKSITP